MSIFYILDEHKNTVAVNDIEEWGKWLKNNRLHVRLTYIKKYKVRISTIFLGTDHGFFGAPILFETMIFRGDKYNDVDDYQEKYHTYKSALRGHRKAVRMVIKEIRENDCKV